MHPEQLYALSNSRIADLHTAAEATARRGTARSPRKRIGWLLIDLGVRLAAPQRHVAHPCD